MPTTTATDTDAALPLWEVVTRWLAGDRDLQVTPASTAARPDGDDWEERLAVRRGASCSDDGWSPVADVVHRLAVDGRLPHVPLADLPGPEADDAEVRAFALTFDGDSRARRDGEGLAGVHQRVATALASGEATAVPTEELRAALLLEVRSHLPGQPLHPRAHGIVARLRERTATVVDERLL